MLTPEWSRMPKITIDDREIEAPEGSTILEAAGLLGIPIPTLCHVAGEEPWTSCMVCVVKVAHGHHLVPSCATKVTDGMVVESSTDEVREARRAALELLLSDHLGDCVAPCTTACPAHMDIPRMIRHIATGDMASAISVVKAHIALPAILGRVCPAPCEKTCRRRGYDGALSVCMLKRAAADSDLASETRFVPDQNPASGKTVAIVGGGPAGLAAAYYLQVLGHACTIFEKGTALGGMLRTAIPQEQLPCQVLDAEIDLILQTGCAVRFSAALGSSITLADLQRDFDAVFLALGEVKPDTCAALGLASGNAGVTVDGRTLRTSFDTVFAGGACVRPTKMAVRSVADGRAASIAIDQMLRGADVTGEAAAWNCRIGKLLEGELDRFVAQASGAARAEPAGGLSAGLSDDEARRDAERCLHCDCRKADACALRIHADVYEADPRRYAGLAPSGVPSRRTFEIQVAHDGVVYEPGKCVACGICVRIAEKAAEPLGLTFIGRGFDVRVKAPFGRSVGEGLQQTARACADACPTGALART
jgi:ferredoxin